jgi:hypothetical protein
MSKHTYTQGGYTYPDHDAMEAAGELTRGLAIRLKCLDCVGGDWPEVARCDMRKCALHPYRKGAHPTRKGPPPSAKQQAALEKGRRARQKPR